MRGTACRTSSESKRIEGVVLDIEQQSHLFEGCPVYLPPRRPGALSFKDISWKTAVASLEVSRCKGFPFSEAVFLIQASSGKT